MAKKQESAIRDAVTANREGLAEATDEQIMIIWDSLPQDVRAQYLNSVKGKEKTDAVSS